MLDKIVTELKLMQHRIEAALVALIGQVEQLKQRRSSSSGRRKMSAKSKARISRRMKQRWAERKRAQKKAKKAKVAVIRKAA